MKTFKITKSAKRNLSTTTHQMSIFEILPESEQMASEPASGATLPTSTVSTFDVTSAARPELSNVPICRLLYTTNGVTLGQSPIRDASDIAALLRASYHEEEIELREEIKALYLNRANKILGIHSIGIGSATQCVFDVKSVCTGALLARAEGVILCHNHPSGALRPSPQDDHITEVLKRALKTLEIKLLDHVIVTPSGDYYSYNDDSRL